MRRLLAAGSYGRMIERRYLFGIALALFLSSSAVHGQVLLEGDVLDADTRQPLARVHVSVADLPLGTITNDEGRFALYAAALPLTLQVRHIGYETQQITVAAENASRLTIELTPAILELEEVFVAGEDFAANVMRKVIEAKHQWHSHLNSYTQEGYTRLVLENDGQIVYLKEAVFDAYWDKVRGPREVVRSLRQTAAWDHILPVQEAMQVLNLYADEATVYGMKLIGPTHPDALNYYHFSLAGRRKIDDRLVYDIYVAPRDQLKATFIGMVSVLDSVYAMLKADLRPAPHVVFPDPLESCRIAYTQQFAQAGEGVWLPLDLSVEGALRLGIDPRYYRSIGVKGLTRLTGSRVNAPLPEALFSGPARVMVDSASVWDDPYFFRGRGIIPLTGREEAALERLPRAKLTLEEAFPLARRPGFLAGVFGGRTEQGFPRLTWPVILGYQFQFRYNRVDGYLSSIGQRLDLSPHLQFVWRLGEATGLSRVRYHAGARYKWENRFFVEGNYRLDTDVRQSPSLYPVALASLPARLGGEDYFDYYWNRSLRLTAGYHTRRLNLSLGLSQEIHESVDRKVMRAWPFAHDFRENPPVQDGRLRVLRAGAGLGDRGWIPAKGMSLRGAVSLEYSPGSRVGSDFHYGRYDAALDVQTPTLFPNRPRPNLLRLRLLAGASSGTLPVQRFGVLDGRTGPFSAFGAFRALSGRPYEGARHAGIFWEHDFKTMPFEALRLWPLVSKGMGVTLFGAHGRAWISPARRNTLVFKPMYQGRFHHELGLSLTDLAGLPLRLDAAWRLNRPGFFFGFGLTKGFD